VLHGYRFIGRFGASFLAFDLAVPRQGECKR